MKKAIALIAAMVTAFSVCQSVYAESQYNMELKVYTFELPINWATPGDEIELPIYINNNPGFNYISFLLVNSDNIKERLAGGSNFEISPFSSIVNRYYNNILRIETFDGSEGPYFDQDGIFGYVYVKLPENINMGDFYSVNFLTEKQYDDEDIGFYKDGNFYGGENFTYVNGGIKIVDEQPIYPDTPAQNEPVQNAQPSQEPQQQSPVENVQENNNQSNNNSSRDNNKIQDNNNSSNSSNNAVEANGKAHPTTTVSSVSNQKTDITTLSNVNTTGSGKKSETAKVTVTSVTKEKNTDTKQTDQPETSDETKKDNTSEKSSWFIPAIIAAGVLLFGIVASVIVRKKHKNN